ncbi:hypothetical protein C9994_14805 [Marivirga lumbricoides]|uniref:Uncharacterized protein n=1 Tax=Marivirga lumbricoides TaxID=1046115 RepID=A0A2T4DDH9_9BACT|nr:hypothetical protein C9994_14805 [Marivirga lumbricoides]
MNDDAIYSEYTPERLKQEYIILGKGIMSDAMNDYEVYERQQQLIKQANIIHNINKRVDKRKKRFIKWC